MLALGAASAVTAVASTAASSAASHAISGLIFGSFNPSYNKEDRKKIRYIQSKYAEAYSDSNEDANVVITAIDNDSRLKMTPDGLKPANPFTDERAYDDALTMNFYPDPVPGHQGKFCASHAKASLGVIIEYQNQRRKRVWVPKVSSPGRPNDYINMFLEEMKSWLRNQLTLDNVSAEELERRSLYITKLKHDNYYWCFPNELSEFKIHYVIDFVHERVQNALEIVQREERNKSLQTLFMELNDHTMNSFEFGKGFLAYIMFPSKKAGADLVHSSMFDGSSYERGKLYKLLEKSTNSVMKVYVSDMRQSQISQHLIEEKDPNQENSLINKDVEYLPEYDIDISEYQRESALTATIFLIYITDRSKNKWLIRKKYSDFVTLHNKVIRDFESNDKSLYLPPKYSAMFPKHDEILETGLALRNYLLQLVNDPNGLNSTTKSLIASFIGVKTLAIPEKSAFMKPENIPNYFIDLKHEFVTKLVEPGKEDLMDKQMVQFRNIWGVDFTTKLLDAHGLLQRMATILGWTLEINHFFVSMFGNTLAFSKLPLKDVLATQKEIMSKLNVITHEIFQYACDLNAQQEYKWHKNLQTSENELKRMKYHLERAIAVITRIENEHLDYRAQMRRLEDVASRFAPLMHRLDNNLPSIQQELGLPLINSQLGQVSDGLFDQTPVNRRLLQNSTSDPKLEEIARPKNSPRVELLEDSPIGGANESKGVGVGEIVINDEKPNSHSPVSEAKETKSNSTQSQVCTIG